MYFRTIMTLYNNFLLKRGVGLISRAGLNSGDYGTGCNGRD